MLTISGFANTNEALNYYRAFNAGQIVRNPSNSKVITFIIGKSNLESFTKDKNPDRYLLFFNEKYLNEPPKN